MMNIADYKRFDVINGRGLRHSLFTSGCLHACRGCFNAAAWNFNYGTAYTQELEDQIIADLNMKDVQISGLSILGGEPFEHPQELLQLVKRIKAECEDKNIWIWSGYTLEEILADEPKRLLLSHCDVLIDGKFVLEQRNLKLSWRGSENQRVLDVAASLKAGQGVWLEE